MDAVLPHDILVEILLSIATTVYQGSPPDDQERSVAFSQLCSVLRFAQTCRRAHIAYLTSRTAIVHAFVNGLAVRVSVPVNPLLRVAAVFGTTAFYAPYARRTIHIRRDGNWQRSTTRTLEDALIALHTTATADQMRGAIDGHRYNMPTFAFIHPL